MLSLLSSHIQLNTIQDVLNLQIGVWPVGGAITVNVHWWHQANNLQYREKLEA